MARVRFRYDYQPQSFAGLRHRRLSQRAARRPSPILNSTPVSRDSTFSNSVTARGGNQFTVEPSRPGAVCRRGVCAGGRERRLERIHTSGQSLLPDNTSTNIVSGFPTDVNHAVDLNSFLGYAPAINRSTGVRAQSVTDPSCLYDAATQRFFFVTLTLESRPNGSLTLVNHLDIAVSKTPDPQGLDHLSVDVTNERSNIVAPIRVLIWATTRTLERTPMAFMSPRMHILGWRTALEARKSTPFSKAQLAASAANVTMVHLDTTGLVKAPSDAGPTHPGFTVWPAQSPGTSSFNLAAGGTEYFLSSNAADEATHPAAGTGGAYTSTQIVVWSLTNTASLDSTAPALNLSSKLLSVNQYAIPPKQKQPGSGILATAAAAQGFCINDTTTLLVNGQFGCWRLLFAREPAHNEVGFEARLKRHA